MSTQTPITTEPTVCSTNWLTKLACKIQGILEPLCEKRSDFRLNTFEQNTILAEAKKIDLTLHFYLCAKFMRQKHTSTDVVVAVSVWSEKTSKSLVWGKEVEAILAPRLTLWNKLGLGAWKAFSVGTTCSCCWGWRVIIGGAAVFGSGFLIRGWI